MFLDAADAPTLLEQLLQFRRRGQVVLQWLELRRRRLGVGAGEEVVGERQERRVTVTGRGRGAQLSQVLGRASSSSSLLLFFAHRLRLLLPFK